MSASFHFKKDSRQKPQELFGPDYQLKGLSGQFKGTYGLFLEGQIDDQPARWFFPDKEDLTRAEEHHLRQGLQDSVFREQFIQPSTSESLYTTDEIMRHASKHLSVISVLSPGGNQSYPAVWASLLVIAVDTAANMEALLALKGIKGLRMGKFKGQTYLMANVDHCQPHIANAALLALLSLDNLALAPKELISDKSEYSPYPKLKRSSVSPAKISKPQHSVAADIEALRALHPDHILLPLKRLKSGSDAFSRMKAEDLKGKLSDEDLAQIEKRFTHDSLRLNAMRWAARGLPVSMAIQKVVLQQEDRDFFTSAHRAGQVLFEP